MAVEIKRPCHYRHYRSAFCVCVCIRGAVVSAGHCRSLYRILSDKQKRKEYDARAAQREQESATGRNSAQTGRRSAGGSIYPGDIEKEFERFFSKGVQSEKKENSSQQKINPMDVTGLFERYMGFKH